MEKRFRMPIIASIFLLIVVIILNFLPLITNTSVDDFVPIIPGGTFQIWCSP